MSTMRLSKTSNRNAGIFAVLALVTVLFAIYLVLTYQVKPAVSVKGAIPASSSLCAQAVNASISDIPSRRVDYNMLERSSNCVQVGGVWKVATQYHPGSYAAFKEMQADFFSGR